MSITLLLTILKPIFGYIKNHKSEFILISIILLCCSIIFWMYIRIDHKNKIIKVNEVKIEGLESTNDYYYTQIIDYEKTIEELSKLTNLIEKIKYIPVYLVPKEKLIMYEEISNTFLETQVGDYSDMAKYSITNKK